MSGSPHSRRDAWLHSDFVLWHDLLSDGGATEEIFMTCANLSADIAPHVLHSHGHPNGPRLLLNQRFSGYGWASRYEKHALKSEFLNGVARLAAESTNDDRLVIIIIGHGSNVAGQIGIGESRRALRAAKPILLHPDEVFGRLHQGTFKGEATLIINSCYSGKWAQAAEHLGMVGVHSGVTVLTRCLPDAKVYAFPGSASAKHRGGFFSNVAVDRVLQAFVRFLPRPSVIASSPVVFPEHNITPGTPEVSARKIPPPISLQQMVSDMANDMQALGVARAGRPSVVHSNNVDGIALMGIVPDGSLKMRLNQTVPANPDTQFDAPMPNASRKFTPPIFRPFLFCHTNCLTKSGVFMPNACFSP